MTLMLAPRRCVGFAKVKRISLSGKRLARDGSTSRFPFFALPLDVFHVTRLAPTRFPIIIALVIQCLFLQSAARGQTVEEIAQACRRVADVPSQAGTPQFIRIDPGAAEQLAQIGLDRAAIFDRMAETSVPETMGCW